MNVRNSFTLLDGLVFFSIFALTMGTVAWSRINLRREKKSSDTPLELLLMGRQITLPLFVASLVSSWYGGITGVTALTYEKGLFNFLTQGIFWYFTYLIFALVFVSRIPENSASTFPELIGNHLGMRARKLTSLLNSASLLPIACTLNLGILIQFISGWSLAVSSATALFFVLSYSLSGGLRSVVYADLIQFLTMITAVVLVVAIAFLHYGSPFKLVALLPERHLTLTGGEKISEIFIWGFIAISTLVDPIFYQRTLASRTRKQATHGILISTLIWFLFDCCTTLGALYARAYFPNVDPNESYFIFALSNLPAGLRGLFFAGILSAAFSTLDASLFSASSTLTYDFLNTSKFTKFRLQIGMIIVGIISLFALPFFHGNIALVWKVMGSVSSACLLFPWTLMMLFPKFKNESNFIASVCTGISFLAAGGILQFLKLTSVDAFYFGLTGSILGFLVSSVLKRC